MIKIKSLGYGKVAVINNGKQVKTFSGMSAPQDAKRWITNQYASSMPQSNTGSVSNESMRIAMGKVLEGKLEDYLDKKKEAGEEPKVGKAKEKEETTRKVAGKQYGGSKQKEKEDDIDESIEYIEEKLTLASGITKWIEDFINSKNPKFAGKSKEERRQMALGAYYGAKNEEVDLDEASDKADLADRKQQKVNDLEVKLKSKGFVRQKDPNGGEYQFKWVKPGEATHVVNYRHGTKGHAEFWKEEVDLSELSACKLAAYADKAAHDMGDSKRKGAIAQVRGDNETADAEAANISKRAKGYGKAKAILNKEDVACESMDPQDYQNKYEVQGDMHGSNQEKPLYRDKQFIYGDSEKEALDNFKRLFGGRNHSVKLIRPAMKKEDVDLGNHPEPYKKVVKKFKPVKGQDKQGNPEGSLEVKESMRLVSKHGDGKHTAKVYKDNDWGEYRVKFFRDGSHIGDAADYHSDDLGDAKSSAEAELKRMNVKESIRFAEFEGEEIHEAFEIILSEDSTSYGARVALVMDRRGIESLSEIDPSDILDFYEEVNALEDEDALVEMYSRQDIERQVQIHTKKGNKVSGVRYSIKQGQPYAEFVVTTPDGTQKKYIQHGAVKKIQKA